MKKNQYLNTVTFLVLAFLSVQLKAQTLEWRLVNPSYTAVDPDGAGPANGSSTFTLQLHTLSGTVNNINAISLGWSYQSAKAMIPATPGCNVVSNPANVVVSPAFVAAGFAFTVVNQCGVFTQTAGGQTYDRRTVGTLDGSSINFSTAWTDVFTVTMWSLSTTAPQAGFVVINSGSNGTPAPFPTYAASDITANEYVVNSLTYTTPLALTSGIFPVTLSRFDAGCTSKGALLNWQTASEENSATFNIEKSTTGVSWKTIATIDAAGSSTIARKYEFTDVDYSAASFYRLRQVDKDGKFTYSSVVKLNCNETKNNLFVYPVPAKNLLNISITSEKNGTAGFKVLDGSGKLCLVNQKAISKGTTQVQLDVSGLSSGQYILTIAQNDETLVRKFTISR